MGVVALFQTESNLNGGCGLISSCPVDQTDLMKKNKANISPEKHEIAPSPDKDEEEVQAMVPQMANVGLSNRVNIGNFSIDFSRKEIVLKDGVILPKFTEELDKVLAGTHTDNYLVDSKTRKQKFQISVRESLEAMAKALKIIDEQILTLEDAYVKYSINNSFHSIPEIESLAYISKLLKMHSAEQAKQLEPLRKHFGLQNPPPEELQKVSEVRTPKKE